MGSRWQRSQPLTQPEAEALVQRAMDEAEEAAEELERALTDAGRAEAAYRRGRALVYFRSAAKTDTAREHYAMADDDVNQLLAERERTKAHAVGQAEVCRVRREGIEAARSLLASARAAETGRA